MLAKPCAAVIEVFSASAALAWLSASPVMSRKIVELPSAVIAALSPVGSGAEGVCCIPTTGSGNWSGARLGGIVRRELVLSGSMDGGTSGIGASSQRQNLVSSMTSQLLHLPSTASANTPDVGRLIRIGGGGSAA